MAHNKTRRVNPLITFISTDRARLAYEPTLKVSDTERRRVSALEWLKHLESPDRMTDIGETVKKTERLRKLDLRTLEKFWRVAHGRAIFRRLAADIRINNKRICNEIYEKTGVKLSGQQIIFMRRNWNTEIQTEEQRTHARDNMILFHMTANPNKKPTEVAGALGVSCERIYDAIRKTGTNARDIRKKRREAEQRLRKQFLDERQIAYSQDELIKCSIPRMEKIILHMETRHGYRVRNYFILHSDTEKLDRNIALLDAHGIPWYDYGTDLYKLLGDKTETLMKKLELFDSVGASPELQYVLVGGILKKREIYSQDSDKRSELRNAVIENDLIRLMNCSHEIAMRTIMKKSWTNLEEYHDAATDAAMNALAECKDRKRDPAATLAIMTVAVEMAVKKKAMEFATRIGITEKNSDPISHTCFRSLHGPDSASSQEPSL
jgi:hypothetical protein